MADTYEDPDAVVFSLRSNKSLETVRPGDDDLHPSSFENVDDDTATETQYFGFSIPEERIFGYAYLWQHPNLGVCSGGLIVFQGWKETTLHAEICDYRTFMSDVALKDGLKKYRLANGYGVEVLEPFERFHMTYDDPKRSNSVDLMLEAVGPCVMFDDFRHFEQTMHVKGRLVLRGKPYQVDCFAIRDRSWGASRTEESLEKAPGSWMCVTFGADFAFNCCLWDHVSSSPSAYAVPDDEALSGGWVQCDGRLGRIVSAHKNVERTHVGTRCARITLNFVDEHNRAFDVRGTTIASCPLILWNNVWAMINLLLWECDGMTGDGTNQEVFFNSYLVSQLGSPG